MASIATGRGFRTAASLASGRPAFRVVSGGKPNVAAANRRSPVFAMPATLAPVALTATVRGGPNAGLVLAGTLSLVVASDFGIYGGDLCADDGELLAAVSGYAAGDAVSFWLSLPDGRRLALWGAAAPDRLVAAVAIGGRLVGPAAGDRGDWHVAACAERTRAA